MKSYSFYFNANDWLASPTVREMSKAERGVYITLLALAWGLENKLPASAEKLRRMAEMTVAEWAESAEILLGQFPLSECETYRFNPRLQLEVAKENKKSDAQADKANKRWQSPGNAAASKSHAAAYAGQMPKTRQEQDTTDVVPRATANSLPADENKASRGEVAAGDNDLFTADTIPFLNDARLFAIACDNVGYDPANLNAEVYRKQVKATAKAAGMKAGVLQFQNYLKKYLNNEAKSKDGIMPAPVVAAVPAAFPADPRDLWGFNEVREPMPVYSPQPAGQYTGRIN